MKPEDIKRAEELLHQAEASVKTIKKDLLEIARELCRADNWEAANKVLDGCGIEYVSLEGRELKYINRGDTYDQTVCQEVYSNVGIDGKDYAEAPFIGSWGEWYEAAQSQHEEEEGVTRCGYCGEFTPISEEERENWHNVKCESCGHYVDGH